MFEANLPQNWIPFDDQKLHAVPNVQKTGLDPVSDRFSFGEIDSFLLQNSQFGVSRRKKFLLPSSCVSVKFRSRPDVPKHRGIWGCARSRNGATLNEKWRQEWKLERVREREREREREKKFDKLTKNVEIWIRRRLCNVNTRAWK